jgi:hypothetical protein
MRIAHLALLSSLVLAACALPEGEDDAQTEESELRERITQGTYVARFGPSGTLRDPYVEQKHVTRLTVLARNAYSAEITRERATTKSNPFMPWLTYRDIEKTTYLTRGTMRFSTNADGAAVVDFGADVGTFRWELRNGELTLTSTAYNNERSTRLRLDPNAGEPTEPAPIELTCKGRYADDGDSISVKLDAEQNQRGNATVKRGTSRPGDWPSAGAYTLSLAPRASNNEWREFSAQVAGRPRMTLRFPVRELERRQGSFDAGGSYYQGDLLFGGDYHLSLRCTHR